MAYFIKSGMDIATSKVVEGERSDKVYLCLRQWHHRIVRIPGAYLPSVKTFPYYYALRPSVLSLYNRHETQWYNYCARIILCVCVSWFHPFNFTIDKEILPFLNPGLNCFCLFFPHPCCAFPFSVNIPCTIRSENIITAFYKTI